MLAIAGIQDLYEGQRVVSVPQVFQAEVAFQVESLNLAGVLAPFHPRVDLCQCGE
jgi:hypothetical protein